MGVLDGDDGDTHGNGSGPPASVAEVPAQQAIDANGHLPEQDGQAASASQPPRARNHLQVGLVALVISALLALAAYIVGWFGAVILGLGAVASGLIGGFHLLAALSDRSRKTGA